MLYQEINKNTYLCTCPPEILTVATCLDDDPQVLEISLYVRGYHAYMDTWNPALEQELILKPEPSNYKDKHAVAVLKDDVIVGYVPYNLAPRLSQFLRREVNKAFAEVTEEKENRGAGTN